MGGSEEEEVKNGKFNEELLNPEVVYEIEEEKDKDESKDEEEEVEESGDGEGDAGLGHMGEEETYWMDRMLAVVDSV